MKTAIPKGYFTKEDLKISGIYFLFSGNHLVYIGKSKDFLTRISANAHKFDFDKIRFIECNVNLIDLYEKRWIKKFKPMHNNYHNSDNKTAKGVMRFTNKTVESASYADLQEYFTRQPSF